MSAVEEIRVKLENRLSVLETEIESLRSALSALDSGEITAAAAAGHPTGAAEAAGTSEAVNPPATADDGTPTATGRKASANGTKASANGTKASANGRKPRANGSKASANGSKPASGRRARGSRRATEADAEQAAAASAELERLLAETGGLDAVELARQTGTDYGVVLARIRQLEQAGRPKG